MHCVRIIPYRSGWLSTPNFKMHASVNLHPDSSLVPLKKHFNPTPSETVQRSKFHSRVRRPEETIAAFVADLRSLAEFCNFGSSLDDMLRDRIVCGVNNRKIQQTLLSEKTLTLKKALEVAQGWETAAKNAKVLSQGGKCKSWTVDSGLDSWTEIWTGFWTNAEVDDDHFLSNISL